MFQRQHHATNLLISSVSWEKDTENREVRMREKLDRNQELERLRCRYRQRGKEARDSDSSSGPVHRDEPDARLSCVFRPRHERWRNHPNIQPRNGSRSEPFHGCPCRPTMTPALPKPPVLLISAWAAACRALYPSVPRRRARSHRRSQGREHWPGRYRHFYQTSLTLIPPRPIPRELPQSVTYYPSNSRDLPTRPASNIRDVAAGSPGSL